MNKQIITSPSGERLVVMPEADYITLVGAANDSADLAAVQAFQDRLDKGEGVVIGEIDQARIAEVRASLPALKHRVM